MKIIDIHRRENVDTRSFEFLIVFLGMKFRRTLTYEMSVLQDTPPFWFRISRWLLQKTCSHKWEKKGLPNMEGYFLGDAPSTMIQRVECRMCEKEASYRYKSGIDTSF